ncbi:sigma-70 family RNA polymerase sigma factor [Mesorhizobium sp. NZP2298]|uniref:sigma-70 family RNA polymerase sigma factor n=1 Tax=Mesorhizobium sp. NZP2298 TaxID=2483403 RepID=UPI001555F8C2|nr:sigma-70 family RNA polymerase sigma factor [Mesorhizobium sp. NZP2298]QKC99206.1 sigma-70 family RNA polymerase sigma factor [Mesorhizobium sp. NZP2298]
MNRPASFDARVLAYMPALKSLTRKYVPAGEREELIQDTLVQIFASWENFRGDDYSVGGGFYNWLACQMRGVAANKRTKKSVPVVYDQDNKYSAIIGKPADQERALIAKDMLARATGRDGAILLRRGMGFGLVEIGSDMGIKRERVRQLEVRGRASLRKACGMVAA